MTDVMYEGEIVQCVVPQILAHLAYRYTYVVTCTCFSSNHFIQILYFFVHQ